MIASEPLPEAAASAPAEPLPPIPSTLVGEDGNLPAMSAREAESPEAVVIDATEAEAVTVADAIESPEPVAAIADAPVAAEDTIIDAVAPNTGPDVAEADTTATEPAPDIWSQPASEQPPVVPLPPPAPPPEPARRGGFWPTVLGGIVAAGLGAGATFWLGPQLQPAPPPAAPEPVDIQALKDQVLAELPVATPPAADADALSEAVAAALAEALPQVEAAAREAAAEEVARRLAETPADTATPETLAATVHALGERVELLEQRSATAAETDTAAEAGTPDADADAGTEQTTADPIPAALQSEFATVQSELGTLKSELTAVQTQLADLAARPAGATPEAVEALATQLSALSPRIEALESREAAQTAALAAAAQLGTALRSGTGREAAAEALNAAGHAEVAELAQSVPSLGELQAGFDRAARDAISADRAAAPPEPGIGLLGSFLADQTKARSVAPREGDDVDAIQSRAGAAVEAGDIPAALTELAAMPEVARDAMAPWLAQAEAFVAAQDAIGQITQPATPSE